MPAGTLPESPTPFQIALDMDATDSGPLRSIPPTPMLDFAANAPMPTPMPGTNLSLEDVNPTIIVHSASVASNTTQTPQEPPSYFDIPCNNHIITQHADSTTATACNTAALNRSYRVGAAGVHDKRNTPSPGPSIVSDLSAQSPETSPVDCSGDIFPLNHSRARENHGSETSNEPGHCNYRTLRYRRANGTVAERSIFLQSDGEPRQDMRSESDTGDYDYTAWDGMSTTTGTSGSNGLQRRRSTWSRHTGLYDGTGYGDETPLTSEPGSPSDGGASDVHEHHELYPLGEQPASSKDNDKGIGTRTAHSEDRDGSAGSRLKYASRA